MITDTTKEIVKGGGFIIHKADSNSTIFTPEDFSEEQIMMRDSVKEFIDREVWPHKERFENKDYEFTKEIMEKAQKHIIDNEDNVETFDETFAVKLTDALDDLRINNYYLMEKEYKFFKKVLRAMNNMRKRFKAGFTESFAFFLNFSSNRIPIFFNINVSSK